MKNSIFLIIGIFLLTSCTDKISKVEQTSVTTAVKTDSAIEVAPTPAKKKEDSVIISKIHKPNFLLLDLDGDQKTDSVKIVQSKKTEKSGLKIIFGNKKVEYLGLGKEVLGQGFDDFDWIGVFEKAAKGQTYFNNVNDEGEIIGEDEVAESDKIKLPNDGIFVHADESCGGGVIHLKNGKFQWIQQE